MVKRRRKVTKVKKVNYDSLFEHPSTWAFGVLLFFVSIIAIAKWSISSVSSFLTFSMIILLSFLGLSLYGGIREVIRKSYDFAYMAIGLIGVSFLFLSLGRVIPGIFVFVVSLIISVAIIVLSILSLIKSIKKKEGHWKITLSSLLLVFSILWTGFLYSGMILVQRLTVSIPFR